MQEKYFSTFSFFGLFWMFYAVLNTFHHSGKKKQQQQQQKQIFGIKFFFFDPKVKVLFCFIFAFLDVPDHFPHFLDTVQKKYQCKKKKFPHFHFLAFLDVCAVLHFSPLRPKKILALNKIFLAAIFLFFFLYAGAASTLISARVISLRFTCNFRFLAKKSHGRKGVQCFQRRTFQRQICNSYGRRDWYRQRNYSRIAVFR